jgi:hypothetical protein
MKIFNFYTQETKKLKKVHLGYNFEVEKVILTNNL